MAIEHVVCKMAAILSQPQCVNILNDAGNDLAPNSRQSITQTAAILLSTGLHWNFNRNTIVFIQENAFENDVGKNCQLLSCSPNVLYNTYCKWNTASLIKLPLPTQWHKMYKFMEAFFHYVIFMFKFFKFMSSLWTEGFVF